jgi:hypothetical protein
MGLSKSQGLWAIYSVLEDAQEAVRACDSRFQHSFSTFLSAHFPNDALLLV